MYRRAEGTRNWAENEVDKDKPKPLVIIGPSCSGKTSLINDLKYDKPHYFKHILCFTDRPYIFRNEAEWVDYLRPMGEDQGDRFFA